MNALLGELRMVKVLHQQSGVCLFTHQWKWNPHAHAEGVDALVMSFTQFAREIDGGEVVQVHFDPSKTDKKDRSGSSPMPSSSGGLVMISLQNEIVQAVLFHDRTTDTACIALKAFLQRILERFSEVFEHELELLQPQLQTSATPTAEEREAVEAPFRRFENELDNPLLLQPSGDYGLQ
ncbi:hypothetical protein F441_04251 [Phytophthora nicotianae CJ01A1]|uniref:Longin domain-containing protein n=5 Tax=Phytophthora nicotianae TaxID=4792 RepID=W2QK09_PHYN3|nr:hypothetical protein PPTG_08301 [Phytophthora nicotianae INRA-310]ETI52543.1 hypothetical protein F443_04306 [Phytophthora nicotianae P1569]ETK92445.1 hypothetical protein L915_04160 [Phytophthora nicotianae]ETP22412.1 hypothetical protein F441_04251 [Phytophthora nicotianae CJ01A1]ETP50294.1 hypothetical protein F442_04272 [Phytophthora nicotianae P10297]ETL45839.1 hypothetical protein L916_04114 [Phytophthora nicotianae]